MLPISLFLTCLFTLSTGKSLSLETEWESFKHIHGKSYSNPEEEFYRKTIFAKNLKLIEKHNEEANQGKHTFRLGITSFADLNDDEMKTNKLSIDSRPKDVKIFGKKSKKSKDKLPTSVDWRSKGIVTSVKYQDYCGSCWAFATVAAIESAYAQKTGKLIDLSEENIVDCANGGCTGGWTYDAYLHVTNQGIVTEECYPYVAKRSSDSFKCKVNETCSPLKIKTFDRTEYGDETDLAAAVSRQVVTVEIDAEKDSFYYYRSGIINTQECSKTIPSHVVALVGYGTENGTDYWIFKNSWGKDWGENGYGRLFRGNNTCGIGNFGGYYPIME